MPVSCATSRAPITPATGTTSPRSGTSSRAGDKQYGPGTMVFHADPHFEEPLSTETGGLMMFVQYPGPTTGGRPIYDGRFNMKQRRPVEEETVEV